MVHSSPQNSRLTYIYIPIVVISELENRYQLPVLEINYILLNY